MFTLEIFPVYIISYLHILKRIDGDIICKLVYFENSFFQSFVYVHLRLLIVRKTLIGTVKRLLEWRGKEAL